MRSKLALAAVLATTACTGVVGSTGEEGGNGPSPTAGGSNPSGGGTPTGPGGTPTGPGGTPTGPGGTPTAPGGTPTPPVDATGAGQRPLRRLSRREYNNTVRDLLGDMTRPADQFPPENSSGFIFARPGPVAMQDALLMRSAAETLAAAAGRNLTTLGLGCAAATGNDACARAFIQSFGLRAYRRPLAQAETDALMALYTTGRSMLSLAFADAIVFVIEGMLQSSSFLYHWEVAPGPTVREGALVKLGPYEIASQLSYFLWGTMPDKTLFDAAAAGKLSLPDEIEAQARRMLGDPRARETLAGFFQDWLDLEALTERPKDPKLYPEYNDGLKSAMTSETRSFVQSVVFDGDGKWSTLLSASYGFVNQALGPIYGMTTVKGTTLQKVDLNPQQRQGFLTQAAFLAVNGATDGSHPVRRGVAVFEKLLCRTLPPPPPDVPAVRPPMPNATTRQRFADHDKLDCARACHSLVDPIGFAFENYDGIGKYRTMDANQPVDASGSINLDGADHRFANAIELNGVLAKSPEVRRCFATQWVRYALMRPESDADRGSIESALAGFSAKDGDIRDLLVAVTSARSFRYRTPAMGEVLP